MPLMAEGELRREMSRRVNSDVNSVVSKGMHSNTFLVKVVDKTFFRLTLKNLLDTQTQKRI